MADRNNLVAKRPCCYSDDHQATTADWTSLPIDIVHLIAQRVGYMEDFISLCSVCTSWKSIQSKTPALPPRFPWVMLPDESVQWNRTYDKTHPWQRLLQAADEQTSNMNLYRRFYSSSASKTYEFELPEAARRKCMGASYGWLLTVGYDLKINLLHPFTRQQISLPPLLAFKEQYEYNELFDPKQVVDMFVNKVAMSRNPSCNGSIKEDCIVVAIYGQCDWLAFVRPGDRVWTDITATHKNFSDIVYYKGAFYAVNWLGELYICDIDSLKATIVAPTPSWPSDLDDQKYIVESSGYLLLVYRNFEELKIEEETRYYTTGFSIFRLEKCNGDEAAHPYKWIKVKDLGDRALFLGSNVSVSLSSSHCVKGHHIYFSEDQDGGKYTRLPDGGGHDTGVFDVEKGSIEVHYAAKFCCPLSPPVWCI